MSFVWRVVEQDLAIESAENAITWPYWLPFIGWYAYELDDQDSAAMEALTNRKWPPGEYEFFGLGLGGLVLLIWERRTS